jgi:cytochrome c553
MIDAHLPAEYNFLRLSGPNISTTEGDLMRITKLLVLLLVLVLSLSLALPAFAQDGAATYKAKCASCHGAEGQGKVGPALKGTSLTEDQISDLLTKGNDTKKPPHKKALSSLSADDAKALAAFVKTLK